MGIYLNPGNSLFGEALRSKIYVDKTGLVAYANEVLGTEQKNICVSRPRRFGKSMAANMLCAYYCRTCDSRSMFEGLEAADSPAFEEHLNQYDVLFFNAQRFLSRAPSLVEIPEYWQEMTLRDMYKEYPEAVTNANGSLISALEEVYAETGRGFVIIIDEWDCIFRETRDNAEAQVHYLDFLRDLLKNQPYVKLAYMTGILPIKKYGTHSALNMFDEYSMTSPKELARFVGFTEVEVQNLCQRFEMDFEETRHWYDGYRLKGVGHVYSPKSVVDAMRFHAFESYWTSTETYEALRVYIDMNFDGLKDSIVTMMGGVPRKIDVTSFQNDMTTFVTQDDVLTLLVHLGYLGYDAETKSVFIPNEEVRAEFVRAMKAPMWNDVIQTISDSEKLLEATWNRDGDTVARMLDAVHMDAVSILEYNNETALSCVISLAYYSARNYYTMVRELPTGKGFADLVFLPRKHAVNHPAMVVELKWNRSADTAIAQIKNKRYTRALEDYSGELLLVGISYDQATKAHSCIIEQTDKR